jgi:hypothetical protein
MLFWQELLVYDAHVGFDQPGSYVVPVGYIVFVGSFDRCLYRRLDSGSQMSRCQAFPSNVDWYMDKPPWV